jgi:hypothetical protein
MELNFLQYFAEMAMISKTQIFIDQEDIAYLKQFPLKDWGRALKLRYNDLIFECTQMGELKKGWNDIRTVKITHFTTTYEIEVDTKMKNLIYKLKSLNYDLTGTNPINNESLFYKPIASALAHKLFINLKSTISPEKLKKYIFKFNKKFNLKSNFNENKNLLNELNNILDPKPNVVYFQPNYMKLKRNDPAPNEDSTFNLKNKFNQMKPAILAALGKNMRNMESSYKNINVFYWKRRYKELVTYVLDFIWNNFKEEKYHDVEYIFKAVYNLLLSKFQNGAISRRNDQSLKERGVDVYLLLSNINPSTNKNWTISDIEKVLKKYKSHDERAAAFKK